MWRNRGNGVKAGGLGSSFEDGQLHKLGKVTWIILVIVLFAFISKAL